MAVEKQKKRMPRTVDEAAQLLVEGIHFEEKRRIRSLTGDKLIEFNMDTGKRIRRNFGLWQKNRELLNDCAKRARKRPIRTFSGDEYFYIHPEEASRIIIEAFLKKLH